MHSLRIPAAVAAPGWLSPWSRTPLRGLATGLPLLGDLPEYRQARRAERERRERAWRQRDRPNPWARNVGLAGRMRYLGHKDPGDPAFADPDHAPDLQDAGLHVEAMVDSTEKELNKTFGSFRRTAGQSAFAIMKKKRFSVRDPALLTWAERKEVAHLHQTDPANWTIKRLADSYPATEEYLEKIARKKSAIGDAPDIIARMDETVVENWAKLSKGQLDVSADLAERLQELQIDPKDRLQQLRAGRRTELMEQIVEHNRKLLEGPEMKFGQFGEIIRSYKAKVEAKQLAIEENRRQLALQDDSKGVSKEGRLESVSESVRMPNLFDPDKASVIDLGNVPSPYRETGLINAEGEVSRDRRMTAEEFKKEQLLRDSEFSDLLSEDAKHVIPAKKVYRQWMEEEIQRQLSVTKDVKKLSVREVFEDDGTHGESAALLIGSVKKYAEEKDSSKNERHRVMLDAADADELNDDKIKIPRGKFKRGAIYERNRNFYDDKGNFLYRIPVETMS